MHASRILIQNGGRNLVEEEGNLKRREKKYLVRATDLRPLLGTSYIAGCGS